MIKWLLEKKLKNGRAVWAKNNEGNYTRDANSAMHFSDERYALGQRMYSPDLQEYWATEHEWPDSNE